MANIRQIVERGNVTLVFDGPLKDTVLVPGRGFTVIRFVANNPGKTIIRNSCFLRILIGILVF